MMEKIQEQAEIVEVAIIINYTNTNKIIIPILYIYIYYILRPMRRIFLRGWVLNILLNISLYIFILIFVNCNIFIIKHKYSDQNYFKLK